MPTPSNSKGNNHHFLSCHRIEHRLLLGRIEHPGRKDKLRTPYAKRTIAHERFLLADDNWGFQVHVNHDEGLVVARLKEKMLDIAKQDIYSNLSSDELFEAMIALTDFLSHWGLVPHTVLVNFNFTWKPFSIWCRTNESFWHLQWTPSFQFDERSLL